MRPASTAASRLRVNSAPRLALRRTAGYTKGAADQPLASINNRSRCKFCIAFKAYTRLSSLDF
jgi:hypothetical protein